MRGAAPTIRPVTALVRGLHYAAVPPFRRVLSASLAALLVSGACARTTPPVAPAPPAPTIAERLGAWPFLTTIDAPSTVALTAGGEVAADPASCGACHVDHYAEWQQTTHASAIHDLQYLAELAKPGQPRWLCLNCHAPTQPQRSTLVTPETPFVSGDSVVTLVGVANPGFLPERAAEGIGCATCHVRRDDDGAGIVVGPRGSGRAPHRVRVDRGALVGICTQCHSPGAVEITPTFVCWFETAQEIAAGPQPTAACVECHMPEIDRPAVTGGPSVPLRRHVWVGGGVPKNAAAYDTLLDRGWESGVEAKVLRDPIRVSLANTRAAHMIPTADPERFLRVEARLEDAAGSVLVRDVVRIGQTWDWGDDATGRRARRLTDNRLLPGEVREWRPHLDTTGAARLVVEVAHVRLTPANAGWASGARLDEELVRLWPEAPGLLPGLSLHYPLATWIYAETIDLAGGARTVSPPAELIGRSKAFMARPLVEKEAALAPGVFPEGE